MKYSVLGLGYAPDEYHEERTEWMKHGIEFDFAGSLEDAASAIPARMQWFLWTNIVFVVLSALSITFAKNSAHFRIAVDIGISSFPLVLYC